MALQEKDLRLLSKFFYKHRNYEAWWTAPLLLQHPEAQSFGLSISEAEQVFQVFEKKGYLKKDGQNTHRIGKVDFQKYRFDLAHIKELREYANTPFWYKFLSEDWIDRIEKLKTFFLVCFVLVATSFIQIFVAKFGEDFYKLLKTFFKTSNPG